MTTKNTNAKRQVVSHTVQPVVRFLMELGAILFATVGIQLAFYFLDGPGFWCGCVQGVFLAGGYHAWKSAQNWRKGTTTLTTDTTDAGTAIVVSRTNEDGTIDLLHSWWCPNRESNPVVRGATESRTSQPRCSTSEFK